MKRRTTLVSVGVALGLVLISAGAVGIAVHDRSDTGSEFAPIVAGQSIALQGRVPGESVGALIERLKARVEGTPNDYVSWATLGFAYVEQSRITADPSLYINADEALARSLEINDIDNFTAYTGLAAVAAARHDFANAERYALTGLEINSASASLYGILSDAQIQLGKYDEGFESVQRMVDLSPDTASLSRVSYTHELTGDVAEAEAVMRRALDDAPTNNDRAFTLFHLGELALGEGDPDTALGFYLQALELAPDNVAALSGKAHALGVTGQVLTSIDTYDLLVEKAPLADFLIEYGNFLEVHGMTAQAGVLYERARATIAVDTANGVRTDPGIIFFEADHGDSNTALLLAQKGLEEGPFFEMYEALAWALYMNGRYGEALDAVKQAQEIGIRDAQLYVRSALIYEALGDHENALSDLRVARDIDQYVSLPAATELLAELESVT